MTDNGMHLLSILFVYHSILIFSLWGLYNQISEVKYYILNILFLEGVYFKDFEY